MPGGARRVDTQLSNWELMSSADGAEPNGAAVGCIGKADVKAMSTLFIETEPSYQGVVWDMSRKCLQIHL